MCSEKTPYVVNFRPMFQGYNTVAELFLMDDVTGDGVHDLFTGDVFGSYELEDGVYVSGFTIHSGADLLTADAPGDRYETAWHAWWEWQHCESFVSAPSLLNPGDVTGDGQPDLVIPNRYCGGGFRVFPGPIAQSAVVDELSESGWSWTTGVTDVGIGRSATGMDVDGNGLRDLVDSSSGEAWSEGYFYTVYFGTPSSTADTVQLRQTDAAYNYILRVLGDIDGDGVGEFTGILYGELDEDDIQVGWAPTYVPPWDDPTIW